MPDLDLRSCRAKLYRADHHIVTLKKQIIEWAYQDPYSVRKDVNADCSRHSVMLEIRVLPRVIEWSLMAGESAHNMRSALDHLVYAIAAYEEGVNPPSVANTIQFPIVDTSARWHGTTGK